MRGHGAGARIATRIATRHGRTRHWQSLAIICNNWTQRAPGPKTATIATSRAVLALSVCVCVRAQHLEATPGQSAAAAAKAAAVKADRAAEDKAAAAKAAAEVEAEKET